MAVLQNPSSGGMAIRSGGDSLGTAPSITLTTGLALALVVGLFVGLGTNDVQAAAPVQGRSLQSNQALELRVRRVEQSARAALSLLKQIDALRREVQELRNANERLANRLDKAERRLENVYQANARKAQAAPDTAAQAAAAQSEQDLAAQTAYQSGVDKVIAGEYEAAISHFEGFMVTFANSQYAPKAQYYLAESQYQRGNLQPALQAYQKVIVSYPNSKKVPESSLKIADILDEMGESDAAMEALRAVIRNYPGTSFESMARQRLTELGG
jgi:tol-pal system protein YbgF